MKIVNPSLNTRAKARVFRPLGLGIQSALLLLILLAAVSSASAAITFDGATASKAKHNTDVIGWKHTIGGSADRALLMAVSYEYFSINHNEVASVKFNGVLMHTVQGSRASSTGMRVLSTQLFYLTGDELPAPGSYDVTVEFTGKVDNAAGGAVSLFGVEPGAPAAAASNTSLVGLGEINMNINAPAYSWVVDVVASESGADLTPGAGQLERFSEAKKEIGIAGSTRPATAGGPTTLLWSQADSSSPVTSAVAFAAKPEFKLTITTEGAGTVQTDPAGDMFHAGEGVTLNAVPASGWQFAGWSGDLSGAASPAAITMDGNKSVTAVFRQVPPSVTTQPASQTVTAGSNVTFTVSAGGTPPLIYQWSKDGPPLPGADADTLTLTNVQDASAGSYTVTVSNAVGSVTGGPAVLTVITPPAITTQPASQTVTAGSTATFSVAASGTAPFTYQWKKDGSDIAGANSPSFSVVEARGADAGTYAVVVSNAAGSATSAGAVLTVNTPPEIVTQPASQTASAGASVSFTVAATGTSPLSYQWKKDGVEIAGANSQTLSLVNVQDGDAGTYTAVVSNVAGSAASDGAVLSVVTPPAITTQPASQTINVGSTATFTVVASGTAPFDFQWKKGGENIAGANGASLTLSNVRLADAGSYSVEVANDAGVATSDPATLSVNVPPSVFLRERFADGNRTNQALPDSAAWFTSSGSSNLTANAGQATQLVSSSRTLLAYFTDASSAPVTVGAGQTLTLDFTVQFSGFDTGASVGSTTFAVGLLRSVANPNATTGTGFVASGTPNTNAHVSGDFGSNNPSSNVFTNYGGYAAMTYAGASSAATPVKLYARTGANASLLNSTSPYTQFTGAAATPSTGMLVNTDYRGTLTLQNTAAGVAVGYTLRDASTGNVVMNYTAVQAASSFTQFDTAGFYLSKASTSANYNFVIKSVDVSLAGDAAGDPPSITTQPVSQTVPVGSAVSFTAAADGTAPLSFQWQKNGSAMPGASAPTLNLSNVQAADAGGYSVVVSNGVGTATSDTATLTVSELGAGQIYNLAGFAQAATGGGVLPETDPNYRKVYTANDLVAALGNKSTKVIEIMNDLDLGYNEVPASARTGALRSASLPLTHPVLLASGVSLIDIQDKDGLTIFSASGATIRHANFNLKRANNVIVRNLKFDELWEWDESTKGKYDKQGWDFITVDMTSDNVWIDHCTFTKAYDGVVDVKGGTKNVTISWSSFLGDDGGPNSFVRRQVEAMEQNPSAYPMYNFLRANGFSVEDIIAVSRSQKKGHLIGANELDSSNANHRVTLHHNYYLNMQDRLPRLRAGNAHAYNVYVNNTEALAAKDLRNARVAAMSSTNAAKLTGSNATYSFDVTLNGSISTEGGAVLLERSQFVDVLSPVRNNQKDAALTEYTGKILALDTIYQRRGVVFRGDSNTAGSPLAPLPAPELPFSWNGFATLPYAYTTNDPSQLPSLLTGAEGAGAGKLSWSKDNWLKTAY